MIYKYIMLYTFSAGLIFLGLFFFKDAFRQKTELEKMQEKIHPPVKNYGKGYMIFLAVVFLYAGIKLVFQKIA